MQSKYGVGGCRNDTAQESRVGEEVAETAQELRDCFDGVTATVEAMSDEEIKLMEALVAAD